MCINCVFCKENEDLFFCENEENLTEAINKVKLSLPSGYEFQSLSLKPLPLKEPIKKCKKWSINIDLINSQLSK